MVVIIPDDRIRNVKLTGDEVRTIMEDLGRLPHDTYVFMKYNKIIKKFRDALHAKSEGGENES